MLHLAQIRSQAKSRLGKGKWANAYRFRTQEGIFTIITRGGTRSLCFVILSQKKHHFENVQAE